MTPIGGPMCSVAAPTGGSRQSSSPWVLVAPDSFKGTFSATEVAQAVAHGVRSAGLKADICPVADGGEGTLAALIGSASAELINVPVTDPLGRSMTASFAMTGDTAIVETSAASGLGLVQAHERDALAASTSGTGELIAAAIAQGAQTILVAVGGSATTDGGRGAIDAITRAGGLGRAKLVVLCDVRTRFVEAASLFGPQKGADATDVTTLIKRLERQARELRRDPRTVEMTGAAGGLAGGLWAAFDAKLVAGAPYVLDAVDFDRRLRDCRAVVTGEGCLDEQSFAGKVISEVARRAAEAGLPCIAVVGRQELSSMRAAQLGVRDVFQAPTVKDMYSAGQRLGQML